MYGMPMMRFAVQTAACTSGGASAGAAARPSGWILATVPATSGVSVGSGAPYSRPPEPETVVEVLELVGWAPPVSAVWAAAGAAKTTRPSSTMTMLESERARTETSFVGLRG
jgi:hypothetical protein